MTNWYKEALKKYAVFRGRARRKEYWIFTLVNYLIGFILGFLGAYLPRMGAQGASLTFTALGFIFQLIMFIPSIAVGVRRMHDIDRSGWWVWLPIVNIVFLAMDGTRAENRYGSDPKAATNMNV